MTHKNVQFYFFLGLLGLIFILTIILFLPFLKLFAVIAVIAVVFHPLFEKIKKSVIHNPNGATFLTISIIIVIILIPVIFFVAQIMSEARVMYEHIDTFSTTLSVLSDTVTQKVQLFLPTAKINFSEYITGFFNTFVGSMGNIFSNVFYFITDLFLGIVSLFFFLRDGRVFVNKLISVSPLANVYDKEILVRQRQTVNSVVKGSIFIAGIQGLCAWFGFMIFGIPNPALWGGLTVFASLIPGVGTALVVVPAVVYLFYTSTFGNAIGLAIWGVVIIGLIDNIIRPILIGIEVKIHPFLILMSVFGGLIVFGPLGLLLGPLLLSLLSSLVDIYPLITNRVLDK